MPVNISQILKKYNYIMTYSEYKNINENIRCRTCEYTCPEWGDDLMDYCFEVFKRPYFWGLIGKKRWEESMQTNSFEMGLSFSKYLLGEKHS